MGTGAIRMRIADVLRLLSQGEDFSAEDWTVLDHAAVPRMWRYRLSDVKTDAKANLHTRHCPLWACI